MRKTPLFFIAALMMIALVATGCGNGDKNNPKEQPAQGQNKQAQDNQSPNRPEQAEPGARSVTGTVTDLMGLGQSFECSFSFENKQGQNMSGKIYTHNQQVRQNAELEQDGKTLETHMIMKNDKVYTWSSRQPGQGVKMDMSEIKNKEKQETGQDQAGKPANLNKQVEYECQPWSAQSDRFALPQDVEFTDMSQFINDMQGMMNEAGQVQDINQEKIDSMKQKACASCEMAPNPDKCRANMGCE